MSLIQHPELERIAADALKPYANNARTHSKKQIKQIAESIARFGFTNPVLIDDANSIIAGHGRVLAAKSLGMTEVPCLRLSHLSEADKRASKHEMVFVFKVGDAAHTNTFGLGDEGRYRTNVWDYAGVNTMKKDRMDELAMHPTVKPVALVADAILDVTRRGAVVLDPFGGSGTTLIAAEKTGRSARLIEFDPLYCDVIIRRFEAYTGKRAALLTTGEHFEDIMEARLKLAC